MINGEENWGDIKPNINLNSIEKKENNMTVSTQIDMLLID